MVRRWIGSADVEIGNHGEQVVAHRSAAVATTETVNVTSDGQVVLAANPHRISAVLVNDSDIDLYIKLGADPAVGTGCRQWCSRRSWGMTARPGRCR